MNRLLEKTYVYPNRQKYWQLRQALGRAPRQNVGNMQLERRLVLSLRREPGITAEDLEDLLDNSDNTELKSILAQSINLLETCPKCHAANWNIVYDDCKKEEPIMKCCMKKYCDFTFGIDDSFSCQSLADKLSELNLAPDISADSLDQTLREDLQSICKCEHCGNEDTNKLVLHENKHDQTLECLKCNSILKLPKDEHKSGQSGKTFTQVTDIFMLSPGDHIYWCRDKIVGYEHHAIVKRKVDSNHIQVYQYSGGDRNRINLSEEILFNDNKDPVYRVDYKNPPNPEAVLKRAREKLAGADTESYNLRKRNCEHFATFCSTGIWTYSQWVRVSTVFGVNICKWATKGTKEGLHIGGFIGKLSVLKGGTTRVACLVRCVSGRFPGLSSNLIGLVVMFVFEVIFLIIDVVSKYRQLNLGELITFVKWRLAEAFSRLGVAGCVTVASLVFLNFAIGLASGYVIAGLVSISVISGALLIFVTWLVRRIKRYIDQRAGKKGQENIALPVEFAEEAMEVEMKNFGYAPITLE